MTSGSFTYYHRNLRRYIPRFFAPVLLVVNAYICWRLFRLEYSQFMGSIEAAYIGISRHILNSGGDLGWWPAWYEGIPFQNSYPPLLHFLVAGAAALMRVSTARAHHFVSALFYCFGPVWAYWAAVRITGRKAESFLAALVYSVVSPSALLVPEIAGEVHGLWNDRRLQVLMVYGEGPHIASVALLPLALWCFEIARVRRRAEWDFLAALSMAAVALTNWLGAFALAALMVARLLGLGTRDWVRAVATGVFAYAIAAPWIPPSTLAAVRLNAQTVGHYEHAYGALMWYLPLVGLALWALRKAPVWVTFSVLMGAPALLGYWFQIDVLPQPHRYHIEMDLGLCFAVVLALWKLVPTRARTGVFCAVVLICGWRAYRLQRYARELIQPVEIGPTIEYRSAKWFQEHMPGERVLTAGTVEFWLNAFGETPQFGGGFLQGVINPEYRVGSYFITALPDGPGAVLWMKAYGVHAVEVNGPRSQEVYKDFVAPHKFDGILEEVWRADDDAIYRVPGDSLAHVVPRDALVKKPPVNGLDTGEIARFVGELGRSAGFVWHGTHAATITAQVGPGDVVSVQENYHPGWHADKGTVVKDGLGLMAIEPRCQGECQIELSYDGGAEMTVSTWTSRLALVGGLMWIWISRRRRLLESSAS
jgi:hypothetical protein